MVAVPVLRVGLGPPSRFLAVDMPLTASPLHDALTRHSLALDPRQTELLDRYCQLLWEWNRKLNLTRHLDPETFVVRDLLDTQRLAEHLQFGERVLDIGTGGGVPGLLLAILRPDLQVTLSESMRKKAQALTAMVRQLELPVTVMEARAEQVLTQQQFDSVVARAVGPLWKVLKWLGPHWGAFHRLLLIKGPRWVQERLEARHRGLLRPLELRRLATYLTPGHQGENVILSLSPKIGDAPL